MVYGRRMICVCKNGAACANVPIHQNPEASVSCTTKKTVHRVIRTELQQLKLSTSLTQVSLLL